MKSKKVLFPVLFISIAIILGLLPLGQGQTVGTQSYKTISSRTSSVRQSCAGISRMDLTDEDTMYMVPSEIHAFLRGYFAIDGSKIIAETLAGNEEEANMELDEHMAPMVGLILPFAVAAVVLIAMAPILVCCICCKPWCFRSVKFWQMNDDSWSWKQLKIPAILAGVFLLGVFIAAIFGLIETAKFQVAFDHSVCSRAILFDDILNGNVSQNGNYFVGLQSFQNTIPTFLEDFDSITDSMTDVSSRSATIENTQQNLGQTVTLMTNIPSGTGKSLTLAYPSPINSDDPVTFTRSTFPIELGSVAEPSSLIGVTFADVRQAKDAIDQVAEIADYYIDLSGPSTSEIGLVQNDVQASIVTVFDLDNKMQDYVKGSTDMPTGLATGSYVLYALLIFFCIVAFVVNGCIAFKNKVGCRVLGYIAIGGLFFLGLLAFALTIVSTIAVPNAYFNCDFASSSASNSENFKQNYAKLIPDSKTLTGLSECTPSSDGKFLNFLAGDGLIRSMQALPEAVGAMVSVRAQSRSASILENYDGMKEAIENNLYARTLDVTDVRSVNILDKLSKSYEYECVANGFHEDSWIPSLVQDPEDIPCKFGIGAVADHTTCSMGDDFEQRALGCVGCMATGDLFRFTDQKKDILNALENRYVGANCDVFIADLANVWENFYRIKATAVGPVLQRYEAARSTIEIGVESLNRNIAPLYESVIQQLQTSAPDFMHPTFGVGAGLSCKLIGEDMQMLSDTVCNRMLPQLYIMLVILGVVSFALMFTLCFLTCSTVRHYDQFLIDEEYGEEQRIGSGSGSGSNSDEENKQVDKSGTGKSMAKSGETPVLTGSSREIMDAREQENESQPTEPKNLKQNFKTYNDRWRYGRKK